MFLAKNAKAVKAAETARGQSKKMSPANAKKDRRRPINALVSLRGDMDVLAARGLYNASCSPLCRLPEDVIVRIMSHLEWEDLYFLRHTSRVFLRLFSLRDEFSFLRDPDAMAGNNNSLYVLSTPWIPSAFPFTNCLRQDHVDALQQWSSWARRCRPARESCQGCRDYGAFRYHDMFLHCTACRADHPVSMFSGKMISVDDKDIMDNRVCVAHEGHVRLCKHKMVDWKTVLNSLPGGRLDNNFKDDCRAQQQSSAEGDESAFSIEPDLRIVCNHPSHFAHTHHTDQEESQEHQSREHNAELPPYQRFTDTEHSESPSFVVHDTIVSGVKHKVITWSYTAHMNVADLGDRGPNGHGAITAQAFRDRVQEMRAGHSPARYLAPPDYPGILPELRCVDPERCSCLLYPGFQRRTGTTPKPCREHEVVRALPIRVSDIDHIRVRLASCDRGPRCLKIIYTRTILLQGFYVDDSLTWPVPIQRGQRRPNHRFFLQLRDAFRNDSVPLGWYQALDPQSYRVTDDPKRHHSTWCRGKRCRLNPAFLRDKYVSIVYEMNRNCRIGCEVMHVVDGLQSSKDERNKNLLVIGRTSRWQEC